MSDHAFLVVDDNDLERISYTAAFGAQWTASPHDRGFNRTTHVLSGGAGGSLSFPFNGVVNYLAVEVCFTNLFFFHRYFSQCLWPGSSKFHSASECHMCR
jgi:hypothetical protein